MAFLMKFKALRKMTFPLQIRHLKNSMKSGSIKWFNEIDDIVFLGAIPIPKHGPNPEDLVELNVGLIVSLNEKYELYVTYDEQEWKDAGVDYMNLSIKDHVGAATVAQAEEIIARIEKVKEQGKRAYVHCKAGKGRSASVVMCYLIAKHKLTPPEVFDIVKQNRSQIDLSEKQFQLVKDFYQKHKE